MPSNHKVYQKKTAGKEKTALLKFFFWSLCVISLFISRLKSFIGLSDKSYIGTDVLLLFKAGVAPYITRPLFCLPLKGRGGCVFLDEARPPTFFRSYRCAGYGSAGEQPERHSEAQGRAGGWLQSSPLHSIERKFYGTENISNKKSGPGSSKRQGSLPHQGTAEGLANQPRGKSEGRSRTCVETPKKEASQESEKACAEQSRQSLSFEKVGREFCQRPSGSQSQGRLEDLPQKERQSESGCLWL